jgi:methionyl-tRNA formyltransferase
MTGKSKPRTEFIFFGTSRFSVIVLDELARIGYLPVAVVTAPDKPQGRKLVLTANPVKTWAIERNIRVLAPEKLTLEDLNKIHAEYPPFKQPAVYIVASYGKIIPQAIIDLPEFKTLNIHPSLLPRYRGASPLQSAMLDDTKNTGVTIIRLDEKMDHGPIVARTEIAITEWPTYDVFEEAMARAGAQLLASILIDWVTGVITEKEQDHSSATFTKKIIKEDGHIDLSADPYANFRKIQAYSTWPGAFFTLDHKGSHIRVKITAASFADNILTIEKVVPEGAKEMSYADFLNGYTKQN